ncbi:MAG: SusC/RagA family TonB-linked outer membrane protein [Dysgonamonadaceae bacterium]|jgi:TonB-linked SusC/RagA family outer membrane protein|nr:SusC/RagA family TonB-linked outer membrane protein [Dysgonamonadaceae bacterium]
MTKIRKFTVGVLLLLCFFAPLQAQEDADDKISIHLKEAPLKVFFEEIQRRTKLNFVYNAADAESMKPVTINVKQKTVREILDMVFAGTGFVYRIEGEIITVRLNKRNEEKSGNEAKNGKRVIKGLVTNKNKEPLVGVSVWLKDTNKGAFTDADGMYELDLSNETATVLHFSFLGMKTRDLSCVGKEILDVVMEEDLIGLKEIEVVATGMFTRRAETFTGAATTISGEELKRLGNQNILFSLKNIDPSFVINESIDFGSDPNRMPDIQMRGINSIPDIKGEYSTSLNQPLFILNGFETTVEKVYDMDMNLVKSVTLLKDAAAKAIYGSKAANGVVIIETLLPETGRLRVSYTGSADITAPDLTSYHLTNAAEKLQAEVLAGKYTSTNAYSQAQLTNAYNELYKEVVRGVDTYWMSQPLRIGLGQKHSLLLDGGDEAMRYSANIGYNRIAGVMKGSDRNTISGNVILLYRYKNLSFTNNLSVDGNNAHNSPYGDFSEYSRMNPYWRLYEEDGRLVKMYNSTAYNPLYNAGLKSKNESDYTSVTENFYGEWWAIENMRITARIGYSHQNNGSRIFIPASHTRYANISASSEEYLLRGQFTETTGKQRSISADAGISYTLQKNRNLLYTNVLYNIEESRSETAGMTAVGFPSDKMDYISFGSGYESGGKPSGSESTSRSLGLIASANYSYANRYLADVSYRLSGSSQFGAKKRWGNFWSIGIGWNIHNESFMKATEIIDLLKIKGSLGYTGSQNFSSYQSIATYNYITDQTYNGDMGIKLLGMANDNLKWQQQLDRNIGLDISFFRKYSLQFNFYRATTTNLLTDVTLPPSAGFATYRENLGETENKGFEIASNFRIWSNPGTNAYLNVFANVAHNSNKIAKISNALKQLNEERDAEKETGASTDEAKKAQRTPSYRYEEGQSITAIWAVPSKGIDPITGQEVFVKKDGTTTFEWSADEQVVCGDATPKYRGNAGFNLAYKGFEINMAFSYRFGGQAYNSTLVEKVENADVLNWNVDRRVLTDRWNTPGVPAKFKSISDLSVTKPTSRFVEDLDELVLSSINLGYDFSKLKFVKSRFFDYCKLTFHINDVGWFSTVKREQGLSYPRARVFSFGLQCRI